MPDLVLGIETAPLVGLSTTMFGPRSCAAFWSERALTQDPACLSTGVTVASDGRALEVAYFGWGPPRLFSGLGVLLVLGEVRSLWLSPLSFWVSGLRSLPSFGGDLPS